MDYRLNTPRCPLCHGGAVSIKEVLIVEAALNVDVETGEAEYAGWSDVDWGSQEPFLTTEKHAVLTCTEGHRWETEFTRLDVENNESEKQQQ